MMTYTARSASTGEPVDVEVDKGRIRKVSPSRRNPDDLWIAPGMIDIQVNGFAGVDYNSPDTALDEIARSIEVIRATGVTRFFPTVITGSHENITGSLSNLAKAARELPNGASMAMFHVEGPWISGTDGPRGAHPQEHVRPPTIEEFDQFQEAAEGRIGIMTLAPEHEGSAEVIEHMVEEGVTVAIGHTNANEQQIRDAVSAGATMSTHLGNGAHLQVPRHDNYITYQLADDGLCAGVIADGIHLPPAFVKVLVRAKRLENVILVTDAVSPAGCAPGIFRIGHLEVELSANQRVELTSTRRLAGSALSMDRGLENMMKFAGVSLYEALQTGTCNPAIHTNLDGRKGFLECGDLADLMLFRFDPETMAVEVEKTVVAEGWSD